MNQDLDKLQPYPFEKLAALKSGVTAPVDRAPIALSIGEPRHPTPELISAEIVSNLQSLSSYPVTRGTARLREAIADWLASRFRLDPATLDPERHVLPVNGTREALFAAAQCLLDRTEQPLVMMPNPFYQIYEGAVLLAGGEPWYLNTVEENGYLPDIDAVPASAWKRCQLIYLCSPGNPTGAVLDDAALQRILELADEYDFVVAADECYSEIYFDEAHPPTGLLAAARRMGRDDYRRCLVFHSLSKRSNAPGLRSGFVAGDAALIEGFLRYRTYHGCAMPPPHQAASIKAWQDEGHVAHNRKLYRDKFTTVLATLQPVLDVKPPDAGFYLWPKTPVNDTEFARELYRQQNVTVLPGSYLSRVANGLNPGQNRVRMALVAPLEECREAAKRIRDFIASL